MPSYRYKARSASPVLEEGRIEAESRSAAIRKLGARGCFPVDIRELPGGGRNPRGSAGFRKIPRSQISTTLRQMADLLGSGLPLPSTIRMTAEQASHPGMRHLLEELASDVGEGIPLSAAMEKHASVFSLFYSRLVRAGETGGMLESVLKRLADCSEREEETHSQIRSALAYPAFITIVGIVTIAFMIGVIIPKFSVMFTGFQERLPFLTRMLLEGSRILRLYALPIFMLGVPLYFVFRARLERGAVRFWRDRIVWKMPFFRDWIRKQILAHFSTTLGSLLESGVPVLQALETSIDTVGNELFRREIGQAPAKIRQGISLSDSLRGISFFPPEIRNLVAVSEKGGRLASAFIAIGEKYDREAQRELKTVVSLLEPVLILCVGTALGIIVVSMMLPIFEINALIR